MYGVAYAEMKGTEVITKAELKQKYLTLIKKYHSDNCQHD
jgi:DnaJ-class molecular chaperone